jgi:hypothetical protein
LNYVWIGLGTAIFLLIAVFFAYRLGRRHQKNLDEESLISQSNYHNQVVAIIDPLSADNSTITRLKRNISNVLCNSYNTIETVTANEPANEGENNTFNGTDSAKSNFVKSVTNMRVPDIIRHSWDYGRKSMGESEDTIKRKSFQQSILKASDNLSKRFSDAQCFPILNSTLNSRNSTETPSDLMIFNSETQDVTTCYENDVLTVSKLKNTPSVATHTSEPSFGFEPETVSGTDSASFVTCSEGLRNQQLDCEESDEFDETINYRYE